MAISAEATVAEVYREAVEVLHDEEWDLIRTAYGWPALLPRRVLAWRFPPPPAAIRARALALPNGS